MKNKNTLRLPVLLYHDIDESRMRCHSSIHPYDLSRQFYYLKNNGYNTISIKQLIEYFNLGVPLPENPVLLTFDGGYKSIRTILYPFLLQYKMKATAFLAPSLISDINLPGNTYLAVQEIKSISTDFIEWGLHSFDHSNYKKLTVVQVANDVRLCINWFRIHGIPFITALSFPFGAYPAYSWPKPGKFFLGLHLCGIKLSFGTGNRLNLLGKKRPIFLKRLEITGKDDINNFAAFLHGGKRNPIEWFVSNLVNPLLSNLRYQFNENKKYFK